jgi:hypothetical protein
MPEKVTEAVASDSVTAANASYPFTRSGIVTEFEEDDAGPVPLEFEGVTINVYAVPPVKPDTVIGDVADVPVTDPGVEVAVYKVVVPPVVAAVKGTDAVPIPAVAVPIVGASGTSMIAVMAFTPSGVPSIRSSCALRLLTD